MSFIEIRSEHTTLVIHVYGIVNKNTQYLKNDKHVDFE